MRARHAEMPCAGRVSAQPGKSGSAGRRFTFNVQSELRPAKPDLPGFRRLKCYPTRNLQFPFCNLQSLNAHAGRPAMRQVGGKPPRAKTGRNLRTRRSLGPSFRGWQGSCREQGGSKIEAGEPRHPKRQRGTNRSLTFASSLTLRVTIELVPVGLLPSETLNGPAAADRWVARGSGVSLYFGIPMDSADAVSARLAGRECR